MIKQELSNILDRAIWVAHSLFERGKTSGSTANMSFLFDGKMYITKTGSCFGTITKEDFAVITMEGDVISGNKPSKEWPLHIAIYKNKEGTKAVIHTHSVYSVLWSCIPNINEFDCVPSITPYLQMKVGKVGLVPYRMPGSKDLFEEFNKRIAFNYAYILKRHGSVVCGKDIMDAFYNLEELEDSARIAWELYSKGMDVSNV